MYDKETFIEKSNIINNNFFNYDDVNYIKTDRKVKISCPKHGIFNQTPSAHLTGQGCPKCKSNISKPEIKWLNTIGIPEENRHLTLKIEGKKFMVDAFDPIKKIVYEFYGDYWHGNPNKYRSEDINKTVKKTYGFLYKKTIEREDRLRKSGYEVVFIWESDFKKIDKI